MSTPTIEAAHAMGTKGGPVVEAERLAFEAWMAGHCWALGAMWDGKHYIGEAEKFGDLSPRAMMTRQLWAAWRDRAALTQPNVSQDSEYVARFGRVTLSGPREDVEFAVRHLPDVDDGAQQPATPASVAWLDEMLADTREVFDAGGSETPQVVRDVIEYVASWVTVYREKNHPAPSVPADVVRVPLQVMKDASEALGNFVSDHGWGDADMQAMDNLDAYIARHEANRAAMLAAK